jgi:OOP family OmpA-OmpF porin
MNKHFAVELGYHQLGETSASGGGLRATIESKAWDLVAVGILPIGEKFSVYGKIGLYMANTDGTTNIPGVANESKSNTDLTYAVGVGYDFTKNFGVRAEYQKFQDVGGGNIGEADVDVMSIGIVYRFK